MEHRTLGEWLRDKCQEEGLSLRQAAAKTGLSHATIADIIKGTSPSPETIKRLAEAFGGNHNQRLVIEDKLLMLSGYRSQREEVPLSEPVARLLDKVAQFGDAELTIMEHFADFVSKLKKK